MASIVQPVRSAVTVNHRYGGLNGAKQFGIFFWQSTQNQGDVLQVYDDGAVFQIPQLNSVEEVTVYPCPFASPYFVIVFDKNRIPKLGKGGIEIWINPIITRERLSGSVSANLGAIQSSGGNFIISPLLLNGGFETAGAPFANWTIVQNGASTVTRSLANPWNGVASCRFTQDGAGNTVRVRMVGALVIGRRYRLNLAVYNSIAGPIYLNAQGYKVITVAPLTYTQTETDFVADDTDLTISAFGTAGQVTDLDDVFLQDITDDPANYNVLPDNRPVVQKLPPDFTYYRIYAFDGSGAIQPGNFYLPQVGLYGWMNPRVSPLSAGGPNLSLLFYGY